MSARFQKYESLEAPQHVECARRAKFTSRVLGCKVNQVEGEQIASGLLDRGFAAVDEESADIVIVHTCAVTAEAGSKARKAIRHVLALPNMPRVVATGCLAAVDASGIEALGGRIHVEPDLSKVVETVAELAGSTGTAPQAVPLLGQGRTLRVGQGFHTRAMVKVQDGCDAFCAYCIVPYARGRSRSVPREQILAECEALVASGIREIVLTGINLGRYRDGDVGLAGLLRAVVATGIARLRLSSVEPPDLTEELLAALASTPAACHHLHVPLQSASDEVLGEMGRSYTAAEYADRVAAARVTLPDVAITTDVLTGFPGESDEQAEETLRFCRAVGFARLHVFRYSPRHGTRAAGRSDQVDACTRARRAERLRALDADLRAAHATGACGEERELLVERVGLRGRSGVRPASGALHDGPTVCAEGTTRDYLRVRVPLGKTSGVAPGALITVRLGSRAGDRVIEGVIVEGR